MTVLVHSECGIALPPDLAARHARGLPSRRHDWDQNTRYAPSTIPAYAGNTDPGRPTSKHGRTTPRRGEHLPRTEAKLPSWGPPPRARGALLDKHVDQLDVGTIPACAGSTSPWPRTCARPWDHPRVHGEHSSGRAEHLSVRGTIPACTGSTRPVPASRRSCRDHPRVHGEHSRCWFLDLRRRGPSPRARGARPQHRAGAARGGTIPACTGSTGTRTGRGWTGRDHPRVHGEHALLDPDHRVPRGPSPRARGALSMITTTPARVGTIPACTGSTRRRSSSRRTYWDHPRVHGEHPA
ncbi:hypothetical protein SAMN05443665_105918 [Actinomadura meyerae]|uniref:Uncharacterized protein n=1 Tax=Actinomadura meyerae TaxID=240840 RepID=A0A239P297_9ACTN|nr:hypothetical protein SAMN05443665_105918 [Actinomadura meyerae]